MPKRSFKTIDAEKRALDARAKGHETMRRNARLRRKVMLRLAASLPNGFMARDLEALLYDDRMRRYMEAEGLPYYHKPDTVGNFLREWVDEGLLRVVQIRRNTANSWTGSSRRIVNTYYWIGEDEVLTESKKAIRRRVLAECLRVSSPHCFLTHDAEMVIMSDEYLNALLQAGLKEEDVVQYAYPLLVDLVKDGILEVHTEFRPLPHVQHDGAFRANVYTWADKNG